MIDLASLTTALQMRDWYAFAALALLALTQLAKRFGWLSKIPEGFRGYAILLVGAVTAFVGAFQEGKPLVDALSAALGGALVIGMGAMGANAALTDSHLPWNGGAGGKVKAGKHLPDVDKILPKDDGPPTARTGSGAPPPTAAVLFLLAGSLALSPAVTACSGGQAPKTPTEAATQARQTARLAYSAGVLAVNAAEQARVVWMSSLQAPTPEQVAAAQKVNDLLHAAADSLAVARSWLVTGEGEAEGKRKLREGLELLSGVVGLLGANGAKTEEAVAEGLSAALALLGSES